MWRFPIAASQSLLASLHRRLCARVRFDDFRGCREGISGCSAAVLFHSIASGTSLRRILTPLPQRRPTKSHVIPSVNLPFRARHLAFHIPYAFLEKTP